MNPLTTLKNTNPKAYAALLSLLVGLLLLIVWWQVGLAYEDHLIVREKEIVTTDLALLANSFTNVLNHRLDLMQGLHSYVVMDPSPERLEARFDLFAAGLYESTPGIRTLVVGPGGVQTYVYPYLGNEATLGHDLLNDTRPSVIKGMNALLSGKKFDIRGPIDLRQGGAGLVINKAIFLNGTWETGTFWGLASMAIDMPPIYNESGFTAPDLPYAIALRNDDWGVFYGTPDEFEGSNPVINMTIGDETWQMTGCPSGGWAPLIAGDLFVFRLLTFLVVVLITVLCYLILLVRLDLGRMVEEKTHDLLESEERFRVFFDENPNPCYMVSVDGTILDINTTALEILGSTAKELVGKPLKTIYAPESQDDAAKALARWNRDGSVHDQELTILSKDGSRRQVLLNVETVTDREGNILHSLSVQTDITAFREVEEESREREEKYKRLFTHMVEGSALHGIIYNEENVPVDYRILEINPAYETILGLSSADVVGKTAREAYLQDEPPYLDVYARVAKTNVPETFETFFEPMGKYFSVSVYSPKEGYFVTIFSDITKRCQSEQALRVSEEQLRLKLDSILSPDYDVDSEELKNILNISEFQSLMDKFYDVTHVLVAILDLDGNILISRGWQEICTKFHRVHPETAKNCHESDLMLAKTLKRGEHRAYKCKNNLWDIVTPIYVGDRHLANLYLGQFFYDDEAIDYEFFENQAEKYGFDKKEYMAALDRVPRLTREQVDSAVNYYLKLADLISSLSYSNLKLAKLLVDNKQLSTDLEHRVEERTHELSVANEHLKELDQLKSMFIAAMSHELRTPLNSIIGFTGLMLQELPGELNDEQKKQLTMVKTSAAHLLNLINDVIDISKIGAGKVEYSRQVFDLASEVREVAAELTGTAEEQNLSMVVTTPEHLEIESDRRRVRQIVTNLVSNAVKFTDEGSVQIIVSQDAGSIQVAVHDTGIGLKEEDIPRLFQAFARILTEGRLTEGTGLGLYLSQEIAHALGGEIRVSSVYGSGSTFVLSLPLRQEEGAEKEEEDV